MKKELGLLNTRTSDRELKRALGLEEESGQLASAIRRALAQMCGVLPEQIHPEEDTAKLNEIMVANGTGGWDISVFDFALEPFIGEPLEIDPAKIPPFVAWRLFWLHGQSPANVGEWIKQTALLLESSGKTVVDESSM